MMPRPSLLLLCLAVSACGGMSKQEASPPTEFELLNRSAQLAFSRGHYEQAAKLYAATLGQALVEDRPERIIDARFNLALSQTYLGRYRPALDQVILADAERLRRSLGPDPQLQLLRATIHYRAGDAAVAQRELDPLLTDAALTPSTAAKAHFLAGVMAADRGDALALQQHRDALPSGDAPGEQTDRLELDGRLAAIEGDTDEALRRLDRAAQLRSLEGDYRGMARALVAAATVAEDAGRAAPAGGYWLRAGRSAAQRGDPEARIWLEHARALAQQIGDTALTLEAETLLAGIEAAQRPR